MKTTPVTTSGKQTSSHQSLATSVLQKHMRVADILNILPEAEEVFAQYGLHCNGCSIGGAEILEDAANMHSMKEEDLNDLLTDLHVILSRKPARPQTIIITDAAASALHQILETEGKAGWVLHVGLDETGGFDLEIVEKVAEGDHVFVRPPITLSASTATLAAIGGATIDYRDGRFKLDLPGVAPRGAEAGCACENGGACECH